MHCSVHFPSPFLTTLGVLITVAVIIVIVIARTAPSTARRSGILPVPIVIILSKYLIPIQWSNGQEVAWFILPAAWRLNYCREIIRIVARDTLNGAFNLPRTGRLRNGAIYLIPESMGVVPPPMVHLVAGFVKHMPHIWAEGSPLLPKRRNPAPAVRAHEVELWKVASRDWIKKDYIKEEVPCPLVLDTANIVYTYESTDVFQDVSQYIVPIQWQASIYNQCRHLCLSHPLSFAAALWWHRCEFKINLHSKHLHYDTVAWSGRKPRGRVESCEGIGCVLEREALFRASHEMSTSGCCWCEWYGRKRERRCRWEEGIYILEFWRFLGSTCDLRWLANTKRPGLHLAEPPGTSSTTSLEMRFCTHGEDSLRREALCLHHTSYFLLRPRASRSEMSSSQVLATVQPSNTATNTYQWKKNTQLMS